MKTDIHPEFYIDAKVKCACGQTFTIGSTQKNIEVEICSNCHPFYTGVDKIVDTAGRVEKFRARKEAAAKTPVKAKKAKERKTENK